MEPSEYAVKYPFTPEAKELVNARGTLLTEEVVERAVQRILLAMEGKSQGSIPIHESARVEEVASFGAARMILGMMRNRFLTNKFAVSESKRVNSLLQKEDTKTIEQVALQFGMVFEEKDSQLFVSIPVFLKYTPKSIDYKLINRTIILGKVPINTHERIRMVEEATRKYIEKIPLVKNAPDILKNAEEKIKAALPKIEGPRLPFTLKEGAHPPCIERLFEEVKKHENLPHQARWYLAVYLLAKGMPLEEMVNLYSNLPDFNEKTTRYQIEHAQKKAYAVPSCATIQTWGLCCAECKIGSPLNWKGKIWGQEKREEKGT